MDLFPLRIFPEGSLSQSVVTTVWLGTLVFSFFNLRLGWTYSGLVVPGYLAPLLIVKPWSAALVLAEAALTYFIVWTFSERLSGPRTWCSLFGRDRFFALFLVSIAVRLTVDGWLIPRVGLELAERWNIQFDYRNDFHSIGLIVVAMSANLFWKPGLRAGLPPLLLIIGLTWAITRFLLVECTNFSIGNLEYMYEDLATDLLATPKAYIVLITTALLASRMNLLYGWEFNGILIPSFMTLLWYDPLKLVSSFAESVILLFLARFALRLPWLKRMTVEGARKLNLFFTLSFLYKTVLGFLIPVFAPDVKVSDFFGFGYMMSTLMAIKAHDKQILVRLTRGTLQLSFFGALFTAAIGFALTYLPDLFFRGGAAAPLGTVEGESLPKARLIELLRAEKPALYGTRRPDSVPLPVPGEVEAFTRGLAEAAAYARERTPTRLDRARALLVGVGYRADEVAGRYLLLRERPPQRGWGSYALDLATPAGAVIEVPAPLEEAGTLEAGAYLFEHLSGGALAISGCARHSNRDGSGDVLRDSRTLFHAFHRALARRSVLQVRAEATADAAGGAGAAGGAPRASLLRVKSALPSGLDLMALRLLVDGLRVEWGRSANDNLQREATWTGFAELVLAPGDRRRLTGLALPSVAPLAPAPLDTRIDGWLAARLLGAHGRLAERGTDLYRVPTLEEMMLFDVEVLCPLLAALGPECPGGVLTAAGRAELAAAAAGAAVFGYRLDWRRHAPSGRDYLVLEEDPAAAARRYWGTYVFRFGLASPCVVQAPRPLAELGAAEYAVALFARLDARALLVAGAHPQANLDGSADPTLSGNRLSAFNLVHQVLLRQAGEDWVQVVQVRALGRRPEAPPVAADVLLAAADGATDERSLSDLGRALVRALRAEGLQVGFVDGAPATAGYEVGTLPQATYLAQTRKKELLALWLAPRLRAAVRRSTDEPALAAAFRALGVPTTEGSLADRLLGTPAEPSAAGAGDAGPESGPSRSACRELPAELRRAVERYVANRDAVALAAARSRFPDWRFERRLDADSQQAFLLLTAPGADLPVVANLAGLGLGAGAEPTPVDGVDRALVERFVDSRRTWFWPRSVR